MCMFSRKTYAIPIIFLWLLAFSNYAVSTDIVGLSVVRVDWKDAGDYGIEVSVKEADKSVSFISRRKDLLVSIDVEGSEVCEYTSVSSGSIRKRFFGGNEYIHVPFEKQEGIIHIRVDEDLLKNLQVSFRCAPGRKVNFYRLIFGE